MESHRTVVIHEHFATLATVLEWLAAVIELFAVLVLITGLVRFAVAYAISEYSGGAGLARSSRMNAGRIVLARYILSALEVFIVADLLMTVLTLSIENLAFLAVLVLIRSLISFFLEHEIRAIRQEGEA